jgi:hypothetical protein
LSKKRKANKSERDYMGRVAALGCIACSDLGYSDSPACVHHMGNQGIRASHFDTIPLCPTHHQWGGLGVAIHAGRKTWEAKFGTERELVDRVQKRLGYDYAQN